MDDFKDYCYLDVQKTGSTFITHLLKECSISPLLHSGKHLTVSGFHLGRALSFIRKGNASTLLKRGGSYRSGVYYFNSIRHPYTYYASLYNYGCDGRGGLYNTLKRNGKSEFYDGTKEGFLDWAEFIMDYRNSEFLGTEYKQCGAVAIGFLTYRFLRLSMSSPIPKLSKVGTPEDALKIYESHNICEFTVRNEQMKSDMLYLIDGPLSNFIDKKKAVQILDGPKVNASKTSLANPSMLENSAAGELVRKKDSLIFDKFYM